MRYFVTALVLLATPIRASDFRVMDVGGSCDSISELEQVRDSIPVQWEPMSGAEIYAFSGKDFDRDVVFNMSASREFYGPEITFGRLNNSKLLLPVTTERTNTWSHCTGSHTMTFHGGDLAQDKTTLATPRRTLINI
jgi:hypothetical protein